MTAGLLEAIGGLGLFLLGMVVMTEGLRGLAGRALRRVLARFTRSPVSGVVTGAVTTALLQSSSATTVAAVGFVGAGLLGFSQALGIVFGANLGTTATGWIVAVIGFKLEIGTAVMPLLLVGVLLRLFARGRAGELGYALAGFGLIFVGIALLQSGMAGLEGRVTPARFPADTWSGRLLLVGFGVALTLVTQSSSAGVATALAALHAGAIALPQAAAMVIGMDVGTTVTAVLATIGGSTPARRTGFAHVVYNLLTGTAAFLLLPLYVAAWQRFGAATLAADPELVLVGFHTGFNVLGVSTVLPFTRRFAGLVERLVPERVSPFARRLDARLLAEPAAALDATAGTLRDLAAKSFALLEPRLAGGRARRDFEAAQGLVILALAETRRYLERLGAPADEAAGARQVSALHVVDHLDRLLDRLAEEERWETVREDAALERSARGLAQVVAGFADAEALAEEIDEKPLRAAFERLEGGRRPSRERLLGRAVASELDASATLARLDALRTLERVAYHAWRIAHHLGRVAAAEAAPEERPPHAEAVPE